MVCAADMVAILPAAAAAVVVACRSNSRASLIITMPVMMSSRQLLKWVSRNHVCGLQRRRLRRQLRRRLRRRRRREQVICSKVHDVVALPRRSCERLQHLVKWAPRACSNCGCSFAIDLRASHDAKWQIFPMINLPTNCCWQLSASRCCTFGRRDSGQTQRPERAPLGR